MASANPISFRLSDEAIQILKWAESSLGVKRSAAIEIALRELRDSRERPRVRPRKKSVAAP